ncbi:MAG TPA: hypothetical protein VFW45_05610 [Candidatus Polarisedimenticolia bacterium]|nr:hypothetical protein [Candidatus Polarisedimenticolia bacterium]
MRTRNPYRLIAVSALLLALFPPFSTGDAFLDLGDRDSSGKGVTTPPARAAASITTDAGMCVQFLSVWVPAQGGQYMVGVSFAYRDMDRDGHYTPGTDKLDVCVNCLDACGWGP